MTFRRLQVSLLHQCGGQAIVISRAFLSSNTFRKQLPRLGDIKTANRLPRFATLTTREREVLKMLAEGNSVKEIACDLNLSVKTVEAHKFNLMRKLDIHNKAQLVQYAIQKKIIKIPNLV